MPGFLYETTSAGEGAGQWRDRKRECEGQSVAGNKR